MGYLFGGAMPALPVQPRLPILGAPIEPGRGAVKIIPAAAESEFRVGLPVFSQ
jgi:hypothetical protein